MISVLLVAGIVAVIAGLLAIGFGIPVKEFSFGNTLILAGAVAVCTGLVMLGLAAVVRELRAVARRLGPDQAMPVRARAEPSPSVLGPAEPGGEGAADGPLFSRDQQALEIAAAVEPTQAPLPPWQEEAARTRQRGTTPAAAEADSEAKPRRNLLFSSSSRKERERAAARSPDPGDPNAATPVAPTPPAPVPPPEAAPRTFEDAWPASEPTRSDPYRRSVRTPSTFSGAAASGDQTPPPASEDRSQVTVLKSGVVDGMAYSLYSDGSIEAQMPEGMMRFASIGELRAHLDQRLT
jgi:hypothetical protein